MFAILYTVDSSKYNAGMAVDEQVFYHLVGKQIRAARQRRSPSMSQAQLAEKLHMSRASIVNIEAGRQHAPLHVLWQIAEVLGTEVGLLVPSQTEYIEHGEIVEIDEHMTAQIDAAANGDSSTRRQLIEFVGRARARRTAQ